MRSWRAAVVCAALGLAWAGAPAPADAEPRHRSQATEAHHPPRGKPPASSRSGFRSAGVDHSGRIQWGRASYYGAEFTGRQMADGSRFDPRSNAAASKTLPLGTTARVTNLRNGRSAEIRVKDRGPRAPGRITDVTPKVADDLGMRGQGVAPVEVAPVAVPQPDGSVRPGAGAERGGGPR